MPRFGVQIQRIVKEYKFVEVEAANPAEAKKKALKSDDGEGYTDPEKGGRTVRFIELLADKEGE